MNATNYIGCLPSADEDFGPVVQSCRDGFDFTIAFEQYFFTILPAALLLLAAPWRLRHLSKLPTSVTGSKLKYTKLAAIALFAIFQLVLVSLWAKTPPSQLRTASVAASSISFIASFALFALSYLEHGRSLQPSPILNAYLLLSLILDSATVRTFWLATLSGSTQAIFTTSFCLKSAILVLEAIEKRGSIIASDDEKSPEATSGLYNHSLFWWITPLLANGFRHLLKPADLYTLDSGLSTSVVHDRFWRTWKSCRYPDRPAMTSSSVANDVIAENKLVWTCLKTLKWRILAPVLPRVGLLTFTICQPLVLQQVLIFLADPSERVQSGYGLVAAYGLVYLGIAVCTGLYYHQVYRLVTLLRGSLMSAVFTKSTDISITATDDSASVTLMSTDVSSQIRVLFVPLKTTRSKPLFLQSKTCTSSGPERSKLRLPHGF